MYGVTECHHDALGLQSVIMTHWALILHIVVFLIVVAMVPAGSKSTQVFLLGELERNSLNDLY